MRRLLFFLSLVYLWTVVGHAQVVGPGFVNYVTSAPSGTCSQGAPAQVVMGSGSIYTCQSGTWGAVGAGAGSVTSVTFTGDGVVLSSTPSSAVTTTGTLTAVLNAAAAGTLLNNATSSAAAPTYTATPVLGVDNSTAGTLTLANSAANAHTIWSSGATTTNTIAGFATVPTTGHIVTCTSSGTTCTLTDGGAAGGSAWSALTAPSGNLSLSMAGNTSIFNTTTALSQMFAWKNTTAAVVGTSQGSPLLSLCGRAFHGSADVEDCMTFSELPGNGNDAAITQTIGHSGTSTGVVTVNVPGSFTANAMTATTTVTAHSTGSSPTFNFSSSSTTGMGLDGQPRLALFDANAQMMRVANTAGSEGGVIVNRTYGLGFGDLSSNTSDIAICRSGAGILGIGTTASACNLGGALTAGSLAVNDTGNTNASFGSRTTFIANACEASFGITTLGTGATTTDTTNNCLPANSFIDFVVARVTTTITAACTGWSLGDATTAARFASNNTTLTANTTTDAAHIGTYNNTGIASATTGIWQASAAKVRITCAGGNPGAGAIRVIVYSHSPTAPTS